MRKFYLSLSALLLALSASAQSTLPQPMIGKATNISSDGFTANWKPVPKADGYCVFVYTQTPVMTDGEQVINEETFSGITSGNMNNPLGGDEDYVDLAAKGYSDTYGWSAYALPTFVKGMVAGLVYSPYLDLRANSGKYKIILTTLSTNGDIIRVESHGRGEKVVREYKTRIPGGNQGTSIDTLEFDNGSKDLFFAVINMTATPGRADYLDGVKVIQNMRAGEVINSMITSEEAIDAWDDTAMDSVKSCRISKLTYAYGAKTLFYDMYATRHDYSRPNGKVPYTAIYSPYSEMVKVNLDDKSSEIVDGIEHISSDVRRAHRMQGVYNLSGQRVDENYRGIIIKNGKKIINQ